MDSALEEGNQAFLNHVGTGAGDYRQRKKTSQYWSVARKQEVKNLSKIGSTQPSEK